MDLDDRSPTPRQTQRLSVDQTLTAPLNNTVDFYVIFQSALNRSIMIVLCVFTGPWE